MKRLVRDWGNMWWKKGIISSSVESQASYKIPTLPRSLAKRDRGDDVARRETRIHLHADLHGLVGTGLDVIHFTRFICPQLAFVLPCRCSSSNPFATTPQWLPQMSW